MRPTPRLCALKVCPGYRLWVRFSDGTEGEVDVSGELFGEVFEALKDPGLFAAAELDEESNTVTWANGADFAPEFLYDCCRKVAAAA
jgi:hypothetical protein